MTPKLIEAARAAANALNDAATVISRFDYGLFDAAATSDAADALRAAIEAAEKAEPAAYRVEVRWADGVFDRAWRKYADYGTRKAAESSRQVFANPGDIETRIVPLYAGEPEEPR